METGQKLKAGAGEKEKKLLPHITGRDGDGCGVFWKVI
jgi:hypothetical protein